MWDLHKHWKSILIRGLLSVGFGLVALFMPALGFELLVLYFGAFALVDGLVAFLVGLRANSGLLVFEGIVGILVGAYVFFFTAQSLSIFLILIAVWAIASGILEILAGLELRRHIENEVWLLFIGVTSVLVGLLVLVNPVESALAITFVIGMYAVIFGLFLVALALKVKNFRPALKKRRTRKRR
ncbi:MAG: HdeD family acid-resistance protein [Candidatus Levyibacteriota bacterium]